MAHSTRSLSAFSWTLAFLLAGSLPAAFAQDAQTTASPLAVVDPYLMAIPSNHMLTAGAVVSAALAGKDNAKGIVADGTTAAVVVYKAASNKTVTFAATNGAKLAEFNSNFLTTLSSTEASTLAVTPTKIGTAYYALALVTIGTAPDAQKGSSLTVTAVSAGSSAKASYSMSAVPTPVVLVHGLWGNILALASTEGYLKATAAFSSYRYLVTPVCYSVYLGFDAATDTLPGHGTGCEVTSAQSLSAYLSTALYPQLDADHFAGGRVDVIAHSMGGLAARHFADVAGYKSARTRFLGAFRNVITLDTPEIGSALATYLDEVAYNRTLQDTNPLSDPYLLWMIGLCKSPTVTVEQCFDAHGFPLSYPGTALSTGAVYSLIPGGKSIASAPPAGIFNTTHGKWYAIASNFENGDQPASLLRDTLNTAIAATYASSPPTVDSILGMPDNDVVVTVASQTATALAAQTKEFKDLQHTPAPGVARNLPGFGDDSNASVIDSGAVNGQVAYWLGLQKTAVPAAGTRPVAESREGPAPAGAPQARVKALFQAPARLIAQIPSTPVGLAQSVRIPLKLAGPEAVDVYVSQMVSNPPRTLRNESSGAPIGDGRARIVSQEPGSATIEVTPLSLGTVTLRISVLFADGGLAERDYPLNVVPSAEGLTQFDLNRGFKSLALVLEDREEDRQAYLFPEVQFRSLEYPIYLDSSEALKLTVDQPEDDPVVRVDADGLIHALRPGTAVVTGDFAGVRDSVKVTVYEPEDAPAGYRQAED